MLKRSLKNSLKQMEVFSILFMFAGLVVCVLLLVVLGIRFGVRRKLSRRGWIVGVVALIPIVLALRTAIVGSNTNYDPNNATPDQIAGLYTKGNASLSLSRDGTYTSKNMKGLAESGTWSNFDWNLSFTKSDLEQPRWITRHGKPIILPYYSGPDGSDGIALKKQ